MNIDQYWADTFGVSQGIFSTQEICVVPHAALAGYRGLWIFFRNNSTIISSPVDLIEVCKKLVANKTSDDLGNIGILQGLFKSYSEQIVGPAYHGALEAKKFRPHFEFEAREITFEETQKLNDKSDGDGWDDSGSGEEKAHYFGVYLENQLAAVSNYSLTGQRVAFPGVYTHPRFRGRGLSRTALSLAFQSSLNEGLLMDYQTLCSNIASIKTAERLGVEKFATHIAIRLKE